MQTTSRNDYKGVFTFPDAPKHCRRGLILPAENNRHQVVLAGRGNDIPPIDGNEFLSYARTLPTLSVYNAIKNAKRLTGITPFSFSESRWRHFAQVPDFPKGYFRLEMPFVGLIRFMAKA